MTFTTGGSAWAATSTRSSPLSYAYLRASSDVLTPRSVGPSIRRTFGAPIASLIRACGSGRRGGSIGPRRGLKSLSPSSCRPPWKMKKPLTGSRRSFPTNLSVEPPWPCGWRGGDDLRPCLPGAQSSKFDEEFIQAQGRLVPSPLPEGERRVGLLVAVDD